MVLGSMILMATGKWFRSAQPKPKGQFWDSCFSIKMQIPSTAEFGIILIADSFLQSLEMKPKQPETEPRGGEEPSLHNQAQLPESSFTMAFSVTEAINYIFFDSQLRLIFCHFQHQYLSVNLQSVTLWTHVSIYHVEDSSSSTPTFNSLRLSKLLWKNITLAICPVPMQLLPASIIFSPSTSKLTMTKFRTCRQTKDVFTIKQSGTKVNHIDSVF